MNPQLSHRGVLLLPTTVQEAESAAKKKSVRCGQVTIIKGKLEGAVVLMRAQPSPSPMKPLIKNPPPISPIPVNLKKPQLFHSSPSQQQQQPLKPSNRATGWWLVGGLVVGWLVGGLVVGWLVGGLVVGRWWAGGGLVVGRRWAGGQAVGWWDGGQMVGW